MQQPQPLTQGELEVMQVLWEHGALKPTEIQEHFPRPIRNAALRSVPLVLLEKGHVARRRAGRAYYYEARTPLEGTLRKMARRMADAFCGGSTTALIAQLIASEKLSADDARALRDVMAERTDEKKSSKSAQRRNRS